MIKFKEEKPVIENNFNYHAPCYEGQSDKYELIREKAKELAYLIDEICPKSREESLAMAKLEEAVFWANAAVARYIPAQDLSPAMSYESWLALKAALKG